MATPTSDTGHVVSSGTTPVASYSYDQDAWGRVAEETKSITAAGSYTTRYTYDAADRLVSLTHPDGEVVTTTYNLMGLPESLSGSSTYVTGASYRPEGRLDVLSLGSNLQVDQDYYPWTQVNGQGRLQQLKGGTTTNPTSLQDLRYQYDGGGNVIRIEDWKAGSPEALDFSYDALGRLTGTSGAYSASYTYNEIGNPSAGSGQALLIKTEGGTTYTIDYPEPQDPGPRHAPKSVNNSPYSYDENGNPTQDKWRDSLEWDDANRLITVTYGSNITVYDYDGDDNRVQRTMLNVTTVYIGAYYEKNLSTGEVTQYYYLGGRRVALRQGGTVYFLLGDHLGSTRVTADSNGNRVAELWYWPYGNTRLTWGSTPTDRQYTGQVFDSNAGLYYYGARYYDLQIGRFISPDPIVPEPGNPQDLNRYSYVRNNPLRYVDPTGRWTFEETPDDPHFAPPGWPYPATRCVSACPEPPVLGPALEILDQTPTGQPIVQFALSHDITVVFGPTGGWGYTPGGGVIILPKHLRNPSVMREHARLIAHELVHVMQNVARGNGPWYSLVVRVDLDREVEAYIIEQAIAYEMATGVEELSEPARRNLARLTANRASAYAYVRERGASSRINPYANRVLSYRGGQGDLATAAQLLDQPLFPQYIRAIVGFWYQYYLPDLRW